MEGTCGIMRPMRFLFEKELKKFVLNKSFFVFIAVFLLNILSLTGEYIDRSKSVMFHTGVHMNGEGIAFFLNNQIGSFGVLVLYLCPLLFFSSPLFSYEYKQNMVAQILVTKYGRSIDVAIKILCNIFISFVWIVLCYCSSLALSFAFFDTGFSMDRENVSILVRCFMNTTLGCFLMNAVFIFVSTMMKSNISATLLNFALVIMPMYITSSNKVVNFIPIIGMEANNYLENSSVYVSVWIFYVIAGIAFLILSQIRMQKVCLRC